MALITTQQTRITGRSEITVRVNVNGGSLTIESLMGAAWVLMRTITANDVVICGGSNTTYRFTPIGGATYEIG